MGPRAGAGTAKVRGNELYKKVLGVVGLGKIGSM